MARKSLILAIISLFLIVYGCKKKNTEKSYIANVETSKEYVVSENSFIDIFNIYFKSITNADVASGQVVEIDGATVEFRQAENALFIDYGYEPVTCEDGCRRSGLIKVNFNGDWFDEGTVGVFSLESLFVNFRLIEGDLTSEFLGAPSGLERFTFLVEDGYVRTIIPVDSTSSDTSFFYYDVNYELSWDEGSGTPSDPSDDLLLITGTSNGTSTGNISYSSVVTEPLQDSLDCFWIAGGMHTLTVAPAEVPETTIDYVEEDGCNYLVNIFVEDNYFYHHLK